MRRNPLILCGLLAAISGGCNALLAQLPEQSTSVFRIGQDTLIEWPAHEGRTYFLQVSDDNDPLVRWIWAPVIEAGNGSNISYEFGGDAPRGFARVCYVDAVPPQGVSLEEWDADGDELPNQWELTHGFSPLDATGSNGRDGDMDHDGLSNLEEHQHGTNPREQDSDGDGLDDGWEILHGLDPNDDGSVNPDNGPDGDPDGDGTINSLEYSGNSNPGNAQDFPVQLLSVRNIVRASGGTTSGTIRKTPWHTGIQEPAQSVGHPISIPVIEGAIAQMSFPQSADAALSQAHERVYRSILLELPPASSTASFHTSSTGASGTFTHTRCWIYAPAKGSEQHFRFFKTRSHSGAGEKELEAGEIITLTIPAGQTYSEYVDLTPTTRADNQITNFTTLELLPLDQAPEILDVNSDFDEGRIDLLTGIAIPDCDDDDIALQAVRDHLDAKFKLAENVTDDMHPQWFGVRPKFLEDPMWEDAEIRISKVDKTDPETGHPESGQVRFYALWNARSAYRGIVPYNFVNGSSVDLTAGGVNRASGESVYGPASAIPSDAAFFMEGVHPGKITLEWSLSLGGVEVAFTQAFQVYTRKTASQWRNDLAYKIRLETLDDLSGEVTTEGIPVPAEGYWKRMERACEYYDFYRECFLRPLRSNPGGYPNALDWAGLARLAGSQVIGGISDSQYGKLAVGMGEWTLGLIPDNLLHQVADWSLEDINTLQQALFMGGRDIFRSVGWQHHAYRSSGYWAIEHVAINSLDADAIALSTQWRLLHSGVITHDKSKVDEAALRITDREQNVIIVPTWSVISSLGAGFTDDIFTVVAKNPCTPHGLDFTDLFPYSPGSPALANAANRWTWIDSATPDGILATWKSQPLLDRLILVATPMKIDATRFAIIHQASPIPGFDTLPILSKDHEDTP